MTCAVPGSGPAREAAAVLSGVGRPPGIAKSPTGVSGLDELTGGGLPAGRATLVCGGPGCGKTLLGATFLVKGATEHGEPGVFASFEERRDDLVENVASLGYDLEDLIARRLLVIDHVRIERSEIEETGEYDLEGLFIRLGFAIDTIGAKRVVLDTVETLFAGLGNATILRAELRRLFGWLKDKGVTTIITGERGEGQLTRHGLEEYVSDCVILLDHRVADQVSTRRLRVVKYRGSAHGTNEYPFLIDEAGISVMPLTSAGLDYAASGERISTGIPELDEMMGGLGYFRGSTILVSGMAGSGKSTTAAHFANAACGRGERCLYFAFEESPAQIVRNMRSIGLDLRGWVDRGFLRFAANRPSLQGLEMHLARMLRDVEVIEPRAVVVDPISSLMTAGLGSDVHAMLLRLIDHLKGRAVTALFTNLTHGNVEQARTDVEVSSLIDTWLLLMNRESDGEYNRQLYILKSRGMPHSNQLREFLLTEEGIRLRPVHVGSGGVLTGSARLAQEAKEEAALLLRRREVERRERELARKRRQVEARVEALRAEMETQEEELHQLLAEAAARERQFEREREMMARSRHAAVPGAGENDG
jgi:circadian clock protein KaiC